MSKLLDQVEKAARSRGRSPRTAETYVRWVKRFVWFHGTRHPREMGLAEVNLFLEALATEQDLSPSSQNQAASALAFLYRDVLHRPLARDRILRARRGRSRPTVLTRDEVRMVLARLGGTQRLIASLMYGSGLRVLEVLGMRVKDLELARGELTVRRGKGGDDRVTMIADSLKPALRRQRGRVRALHQKDKDRGAGWVCLPGALHRKAPEASRDLAWQYLFPSRRISADASPQGPGRHHLHPTAVQRAVSKAVKEAGLLKRATCHTFRHSFATHLLEDGYDIRTIQELLGHKSVHTTMIYTHVLNRGTLGVRSPLDRK